MNAKTMDLRYLIQDAKAEHLRDPISDAKAMDRGRRLGDVTVSLKLHPYSITWNFASRLSMLKPWIFEIGSSVAKAMDLRSPTLDAGTADPRPPTSLNSGSQASDFPKFSTPGLRLP